MKTAKELLSNIQPEQKNMSEIINQVQQLKFDEHDERAKASLKDFYKKITGATYTQDERIMIMSSLNQMTEFACVVLGRFLDEEETDIKKKWDVWVKAGSNPEEKPLYKSINGFLEYYKKTLGISTSKAYYCMDLYRRYDINNIIELGINKVIATSIIKDEELLNEVVQQAIAEDWDGDKIKEVSRAIKQIEKIDDEKTKKKLALTIIKNPEPEEVEKKLDNVKAVYDRQVQTKKDEESITFKKYAYDIFLNAEDIKIDKDRDIIIRAKNKKQKNLIVNALNYYEKGIKNYVRKSEEGAE